MPDIQVDINFEPKKLAAGKRENGEIVINLTNVSKESIFWCECDVHMDNQFSLAIDRDLTEGRTRIGIIKPGSSSSKRVRFYTKHGSVPGNYKVSVTSYAYGEDGAIAERSDIAKEIEFF
ncbi:MAG: hypothetical protein QXN59_01665 [Candidatus Micrarchaeaceae archaeon]